VARSPDRATGPTEGLHTLTLPGCPLAWQEAGWRYNHNLERYRIHADAAVYYLTYSVVEWLPVFVSRASCQLVTESLSFCHRAEELRVNAYVMMPTHLPMIVFDAEWDSERLRRTLADLRKFTGRQLRAS
jgi:hypothetical protein